MKKKVLSLLLSAAMLTAFAAGCKKDEAKNDGEKEIYFLNFKPEIESKYKAIAEAYKKETGVTVKVVTAAGGTYETTLKSEISKSDAPTIFQINGPVGYQSWKEYTANLKDTKLYSTLLDKTMAVTDGDGVYGIPYVVEGYGIIYNDAIMQKYFALSDKAVSIKSTDEINNFDTLKKVVEDMTKHKDALGIKGVFASTSLGAGEQWRWQTHLANMPLFYEFKDKAGDGSVILTGLDSKEIDFKYNENFKNIFDLYINNSITDSKLLGSKTVTDSMAEFALGEVAMVQNGNWAWSQISDVDGNTVKESDIKYLPIYTGVAGEEKYGLCVGTENYFAVNKKVSKEKQEESIKFLEWLFGSAKGKEFVTKELGFIAPFNTFSDNEKPADPLAKEVLAWMGKDGVESVTWTFQAFPSEDFKNYFGDSLLQYAQGKKSWDDVKKVVVEKWASEKAK